MLRSRKLKLGVANAVRAHAHGVWMQAVLAGAWWTADARAAGEADRSLPQVKLSAGFQTTLCQACDRFLRWCGKPD